MWQTGYVNKIFDDWLARIFRWSWNLTTCAEDTIEANIARLRKIGITQFVSFTLPGANSCLFNGSVNDRVINYLGVKLHMLVLNNIHELSLCHVVMLQPTHLRTSLPQTVPNKWWRGWRDHSLGCEVWGSLAPTWSFQGNFEKDPSRAKLWGCFLLTSGTFWWKKSHILTKEMRGGLNEKLFYSIVVTFGDLEKFQPY